MHPRIERAELWILNLVVDCLYPIGALREQEVGWHFHDYHGLSNVELLPVLNGLFARGDLTAFSEGDHSVYCPSPELVEALVLSAVTSDPFVELSTEPLCELNCYFGLTSQGGARWEVAFRPDWARYVRVWPESREYEAMIEAATREADANAGVLVWPTPKRYEARGVSGVFIEAYLRDSGVDPRLPSADSEWETIRPYQVTYWKNLPEGQLLRFRLPQEILQSGKYWSPNHRVDWYTMPDLVGSFPPPPNGII